MAANQPPNAGSPLNNGNGQGNNPPKPPDGDAPLIFPPEQTVWKKYSAHYEFPLSILTSVSVHFFVFMMVVLFGALLLGLGHSEPPEVETVEFAGGGGSGDGASTPQEMQEVAMKEPELTFKLDDVNIDDSTKRENLAADLSSDEQFKGQFDDPSKRVGEQGKGGSGAGGGLGDGFGTGEGSGSGPGKQKKRAKRTDRWALALRYSNGEELYQEWAKMKAIIVMPEGQPEKGDYTKFRVYRDLTTKAPQGKIETRETLNTLNRVWFFDRNRDSVQALSKFLGYATPPRFIALFIPRDLEDELLRKELAYKNKKEDQLEGWETTFEVSRVGDKFNARVLEQKKKPTR